MTDNNDAREAGRLILENLSLFNDAVIFFEKKYSQKFLKN